MLQPDIVIAWITTAAAVAFLSLLMLDQLPVSVWPA